MSGSETINRNSMLYWYPLVKDLPIPQPKTEIVLRKNNWWKYLDGKNLPDKDFYKDKLKDRIKSSWDSYLSLVDAEDEIQLERQLRNITEAQVKRFKEDDTEINEIAQQILNEILTKYLLPLPV